MSSCAEPHVWLGIDKAKEYKQGKWMDVPYLSLSKMHLNRKQARQLAEELEIFADTGELK
jgi:hypothetical protein